MLWSVVKDVFRSLRSGATAPISPGKLEGEELRALLGRPDPVILDVGCNDGQHSAWFLELFPGARVYAFEPDPRAAKAFRATVRSERAKLFEIAVAARDGTATFHASDGLPDPKVADLYPEGWHQSGSLRRPGRSHQELYPWCRFERTFEVQTRRLDGWCSDEGVGPIDLVWADVQGAEGDLVEGGREALARTRYFYTEYDDNELYEGQLSLAQLVKLLPEFEIVRRYRWDVLLRNRRLA